MTAADQVAALGAAAITLADLVDRCMLYGPADACRDATRRLRAAVSDADLATLARWAETGRLVEEACDLCLEVAIDVVGPHGCNVYFGGDVKATFAPTILDALRATLEPKEGES